MSLLVDIHNASKQRDHHAMQRRHLPPVLVMYESDARTRHEDVEDSAGNDRYCLYFADRR